MPKKHSLSKKIIFAILVIIFMLNISVLGLEQAVAADAPIYNKIFKEKLEHMKTELGLPAPEGDRSPLDLAVRVIRIALSTLALIFLILIIVSGFRWMTSGGNEESITKAKSMIRSALIGIVIIFFAYAITLFVFNLTNKRWGWW